MALENFKTPPEIMTLLRQGRAPDTVKQIRSLQKGLGSLLEGNSGQFIDERYLGYGNWPFLHAFASLGGALREMRESGVLEHILAIWYEQRPDSGVDEEKFRNARGWVREHMTFTMGDIEARLTEIPGDAALVYAQDIADLPPDTDSEVLELFRYNLERVRQAVEKILDARSITVMRSKMNTENLIDPNAGKKEGEKRVEDGRLRSSKWEDLIFDSLSMRCKTSVITPGVPDNFNSADLPNAIPETIKHLGKPYDTRALGKQQVVLSISPRLDPLPPTLEEIRDKLTKHDRSRVVLDGMETFAALHAKGLTYSDFKPANLFVFSSNQSGYAHGKTFDFETVTPREVALKTLGMGTEEYAPHCYYMKGNVMFATPLLDYPEANDVFTAGMVVLEMHSPNKKSFQDKAFDIIEATGKIFKKESISETERNEAVEKLLFDGVDELCDADELPSVKQCIKDMIQFDASKRPTMAEAIERLNQVYPKQFAFAF